MGSSPFSPTTRPDGQILSGRFCSTQSHFETVLEPYGRHPMPSAVAQGLVALAGLPGPALLITLQPLHLSLTFAISPCYNLNV